MRRAAGAAVIYASLSFLLFGRDVVGDPAGRVVGDAAADKTLYMWSLEWWPFALGRGRNPSMSTSHGCRTDSTSVWAPPEGGSGFWRHH